MSDLKQRALALYKPPFRRVHGYIYDADSRVVADDAAAKDEDAALRIRGWGRIQYLEDPEALQDTAGDLIAEALTEYWQRRTQPEATAPAQDLSAAILAMDCPDTSHYGVSKAVGYEQAWDECRRAAAALASPADALVAGDRVDAERWRAFLGSQRIRPLGSAGLEQPQPNNYAHMGLEIWTVFGRDYSPELLEELDKKNELGRRWLTMYADVARAAIQAQKDGHG